MSDGLKDIFQSTKTGVELEKKTNSEIADLIMAHIWADFDIFSPESDLVGEAIERLKKTPPMPDKGFNLAEHQNAMEMRKLLNPHKE